VKKGLQRSDPSSWLETVWEALEHVRDEHLLQGDEVADAQWDDLCTAMAWIAEQLGVEDDFGMGDDHE
jgi:hypothetical protein